MTKIFQRNPGDGEILPGLYTTDKSPPRLDKIMRDQIGRNEIILPFLWIMVDVSRGQSSGLIAVYPEIVSCHFNAIRIKINRPHFTSTAAEGHQRQNSRPCPNIEKTLETPAAAFNQCGHKTRGFMQAAAEGHTRIDIKRMLALGRPVSPLKPRREIGRAHV